MYENQKTTSKVIRNEKFNILSKYSILDQQHFVACTYSFDIVLRVY